MTGAGFILGVGILGILPPISRDHPGRQEVPAVGHIVYGAALAGVMNRFTAARRGGRE